MRDYARIWGIVCLSENYKKERLIENNGMPVLFRSLSQAKRFLSSLKSQEQFVPINLGIYGQSPHEIVGASEKVGTEEYHREIMSLVTQDYI